MLIDAILRLHDKVMHEPLGERRRKQIEAAHSARPPVVEPGEMPSSYRFNKTKKAEWERATSEGREEQLRIENWMRERAGTALRLEGKQR
jgi:NADH-quinone oxidoreductase subunit B